MLILDHENEELNNVQINHHKYDHKHLNLRLNLIILIV